MFFPLGGKPTVTLDDAYTFWNILSIIPDPNLKKKMKEKKGKYNFKPWQT